MNERFVVLDIETKDSFVSAGAYDATRLSVSCVGLYTSHNDTFECFPEEGLNTLWPLLEHADRVIGFNLDGFDYPVLKKYYPGDFSRIVTLDMLTEFKKDHGFRIKLDSLAKETLGVGKSGDGLGAIRLWEQGKLEELYQYCLDDVRITRDLFLHGRDKGVLYYVDRLGKRVTWMVDWAPEVTDQTAPLTLPF